MAQLGEFAAGQMALNERLRDIVQLCAEDSGTAERIFRVNKV